MLLGLYFTGHLQRLSEKTYTSKVTGTLKNREQKREGEVEEGELNQRFCPKCKKNVKTEKVPRIAEDLEDSVVVELDIICKECDSHITYRRMRMSLD